MEIDILSVAVLGSALSLLFHWTKGYFGTDETGSKVAMVLLSFVIGGVYFLLKDTSLWPTVVGVLGASQTFYAFFLKQGD